MGADRRDLRGSGRTCRTTVRSARRLCDGPCCSDRSLPFRQVGHRRRAGRHETHHGRPRNAQPPARGLPQSDGRYRRPPQAGPAGSRLAAIGRPGLRSGVRWQRGAEMCAGRQSPLLARRSRHDVVDPVRGRARWISGQRRTLCPRRLGAAQPCTGRRDDAGGRRDRAGPPGDRHSTRRRRLPVRCRACGRAKAAGRWRRGRRSLSPMRLRSCSRPCCQPRREAVSGRPMPANLCRSRCFRRRSDCRCVRQRLAFEAIRRSCCRPG